jgi:hypothetical protein
MKLSKLPRAFRAATQEARDSATRRKAAPPAQRLDHGKLLGDQIRALEERAGIAKQVEDAQLGPMFPDLEATSDEYFRDVEDHARRKVRKLYFGVQDVDLRKQLIAKNREGDRLHEAVLAAQLQGAREAVARGQREADSQPWGKAGIMAVICVGIGAWLFQLYGAIGGALLGFFLGQSVVARARTERTEALRAAQAELDDEIKGQREVRLRPAWFNAEEARTGERDDSFDHKSVIANYYAAEREGRVE